MVNQAAGVIREIARYPVKSMKGERLESVELAPYGLYGDRSHAFIDASKQGWDRYITARKIPRMLLYTAVFQDCRSDSNGFPALEVTGPDGQLFGWDEKLAEQLQPFTKAQLTMLKCEPARPDSQAGDGSGPDLLAVDTDSVLLVTDASLREVERLWGERVDFQRFRPNLVINLSDDLPFIEKEWIGKQLAIGDTLLQVNSLCERCVMITMDPETLERSPALGKILYAEQNHCFGIYASVLRTGHIHVGDSVYVDT